MYSRAGSTPPISSTTRSERSRMSSKSPRDRVKTPDSSGRSPVENSIESARSSSSVWSAPPTVPWPRSPTLNVVTSRQVLVGLAAHDRARAAVLAEDHRRPGDRVVVVGHRMPVGAGRRHDEDVAYLRIIKRDVADQDVARFAMHPGNGDDLLATEPVGDIRLVFRAVEHRPQVVDHPTVDGNVRAHAGNLLDGSDGVDRDARVSDQRAPRLAQ